MRATAKFLGILWMGIVAAVGLWLAITETFFGAPGILFRGGYGDIYILAFVGFHGYWLYRWGSRV